jgi:hypothetical protein
MDAGAPADHKLPIEFYDDQRQNRKSAIQTAEVLNISGILRLPTTAMGFRHWEDWVWLTTCCTIPSSISIPREIQSQNKVIIYSQCYEAQWQHRNHPPWKQCDGAQKNTVVINSRLVNSDSSSSRMHSIFQRLWRHLYRVMRQEERLDSRLMSYRVQIETTPPPPESSGVVWSVPIMIAALRPYTWWYWA